MRDRLAIFLSGIMWLVFLFSAWGIPYSIWIAFQLENVLLTDVFDLSLAVVGLVGLAGVTLKLAILGRLFWKVVFVLLCLEHVNWMVVLPWLGVPQLGELASGGPMRIVEGIMGVVFVSLLFLYGFRSDYIWSKGQSSEQTAA